MIAHSATSPRDRKTQNARLSWRVQADDLAKPALFCPVTPELHPRAVVGLALAQLLMVISLMKVAIPHWQGRVSPVFDVAGNLLLVDVANGQEQTRQDVRLETDDLQARASSLAELGADVLICGAISWPLEMALSVAGLEVIPQTCGNVEDVLAAFLNGGLDQNAFLMPGCCGRRRRFRKRRRRSPNPGP